MTKFSAWKMAGAIFVLCAATEIVASAQTFTTLVTFDGNNGLEPEMSLVQGIDGNFYGTTVGGGGYGSVFKLAPRGSLTTLQRFNLGDGASPSGLALGTDGNFYGTTYDGGGGPYFGGGTVFRISPSGKLTTLYEFCLGYPSCSDGLYPAAALVQGSNGYFYGTTKNGGNSICSANPGGCGTIFTITSTGRLITLHLFEKTDGAAPVAALIQATDGDFYGTTSDLYSAGTIFKMTPTGKLTTLYTFCTQTNCTDGFNPVAALVEGADGNFYGTTVSGGDDDEGTVFKITPLGILTTLHSFNRTDGANPKSPLIQATDGNFYGTTSAFGTNNAGTLFQITSAGLLNTLYMFCSLPGCADGSTPMGGFLQATNGILYGTTYQGGSGANIGTAFSLDMGLGPFVAFVRNPAKVAQTFGILGQGFTGTTSVSLNGVLANFTVVSDTLIKATVPAGATTGYVTVTTPSGTLTSNVPFRVIK
jgi:uncharacterized repeat protein (TIGR03803 family)